MTDLVAALQDAWTELRIHRGRVLMSLIGVGAAIAALTASVALGEVARTTLERTLDSQTGRPATVSVQVYPQQSPSSTGEEALAAARATAARYDVAYASPIVPVQAQVGGTGGSMPVQIQGVDPSWAIMHRFEVAEGRFLVESDRARLAPAVVINRAVELRLGETRTIEVGGTTAVVVGVVDRGLTDLEWGQAWMLPEAALAVQPPEEAQYGVNLQLEAWVPEELSDTALTFLQRDLRGQLEGVAVEAFRADWRAWDSDPIGPIQLVLVATAVVILILGALGLVTVAVVSIRARVRELGIRRAFGASRARIFVAVMLESVVGTVFAGAIGIAICIFAYRLPIVEEMLTQGLGGELPGFPMAAALTGLVVSAIVGAIAGSVPATIAVRSKVIEAIRF